MEARRYVAEPAMLAPQDASNGETRSDTED